VADIAEQGSPLTRDTVLPVALDDSWLNAKWAVQRVEWLRERYILDFSGWRSSAVFEAQVQRLLRVLTSYAV
jgi:hypothetical protein